MDCEYFVLVFSVYNNESHLKPPLMCVGTLHGFLLNQKPIKC